MYVVKGNAGMVKDPEPVMKSVVVLCASRLGSDGRGLGGEDVDAEVVQCNDGGWGFPSLATPLLEIGLGCVGGEW